VVSRRWERTVLGTKKTGRTTGCRQISVNFVLLIWQMPVLLQLLIVGHIPLTGLEEK
jgi:hypothetical protein